MARINFVHTFSTLCHTFSHFCPQHFSTVQATGEVQLEAPDPVREVQGGFFCDEPGLGKTITALSLILRTLGLLPRPPPDAVVEWTQDARGRPCGLYRVGGAAGLAAADGLLPGVGLAAGGENGTGGNGGGGATGRVAGALTGAGSGSGAGAGLRRSGRRASMAALYCVAPRRPPATQALTPPGGPSLTPQQLLPGMGVSQGGHRQDSGGALGGLEEGEGGLQASAVAPGAPAAVAGAGVTRAGARASNGRAKTGSGQAGNGGGGNGGGSSGDGANDGHHGQTWVLCDSCHKWRELPFSQQVSVFTATLPLGAWS